MRVHPKNKIKKLKLLRRQGFSINELVSELNIPKTTVWHHIKEVKVFLNGAQITRTAKKFVNDGTTDLKWVWFFMPGGLEDFFEGIGKVRQPGEATPPEFARPSDVEAIEKATVFASKSTGST